METISVLLQWQKIELEKKLARIFLLNFIQFVNSHIYFTEGEMHLTKFNRRNICNRSNVVVPEMDEEKM